MERTLPTTETLNQLSAVILDSAIAVHKEMGPGLLEAVYQHCMVKELRSRGIFVSMIISYLKLANKHLGFLINFNVPLLKHGFKRFVNKFQVIPK